MNVNTESLNSLISTNNAFIRKRKRNGLSISRSGSETKKLRHTADFNNENKRSRKPNDHICSKKKWNTTKHNRLPIKFLLGGNFTDPLNLNSLSDEKVSAVLNAITPIASPIPFKHNNKDVLIPVRIPANIHDPLNLCGQESEDILAERPLKRKKKRRYVKKITHDKSDNSKICSNIPDEKIKAEIKHMKDERKIEDYKLRKVTDKIVSPVVPPLSPKWKRRRTSSDCRHLEGDLNNSVTLNEDSKRTFKHERQGRKSIDFPKSISKRNNFRRFQYGNYNNYIGYKNYDYNDARLESLPADTFENKDVLDIGCNVGYLSLAIATKYNARKVVGIDVDEQLIKAAKTNFLHYIDDNENSSVPISCQNLGPITSHLLMLSLCSNYVDKNKFPFNIHFKKENYVPHSEEILYSTPKEFDVILALGVTKYIHLNYGDEALTRSLKKMYLQLRPGGRLILQAQQWRSYKKKKRTTEKIMNIYKGINLYPEYFKNYLLGEVGFESCTLLAKINLPHKPDGFQQFILEFKKSSQPSSPICLNAPSIIPNFDNFSYTVSSMRTCSSCGSPLQMNESVTSCSTCPNTPSIASHLSTSQDYQDQ